MDNAYFSSHEKRSYPTFAYTGKHLANYSQRLSIISKQSKINTQRIEISGENTCNYQLSQEKRKISCKFSPNFFYY